MKYIAPLLLVFVFCAACTDTAIIDQNRPIADYKWRYDAPANIDVHITDTNVPYRIYVNFRHTPDYRYSNIFMLVHTHEPSGKDSTERIELTLAAPDGRWLGSGGGSVYTHQQLIKDHYFFADTGHYTFSIEQNMRENPLPDVTDVGLRIDRAN